MLSTLLLTLPLLSPQDTAPIQALVEVALTPAQVPALLALDLDVAHLNAARGEARLIVDRLGHEALTTAGFAPEVLTADLAAWYAARLDAEDTPPSGALGAWLSPPFGQGSMGGNYTLGQVTSVLDQLAATYPAIVAPKVSIGQTVEGREQWMLKISDNPLIDEAEPEVRMDALHHAREPQSMQTTLWFMLFLVEGYGNDPFATYLVDERELYFVPVVNPDGYAYNEQTNPQGGGLWRKNRRLNAGGSIGVDLNRNYPYQWGFDTIGSSPTPSSQTYRGTGPASEPEIANMVAFIGSRQFQTALTAHSYSNYWLAPWSYNDTEPANYAEFEEIQDLAVEVNGYAAGPAWLVLYNMNGSTLDYDTFQHGTLSWLPEIGSAADGFWPPTSRIIPLAQENQLAFQRTALAAGAWLRVSDAGATEVGDGDGFFEAGEALELLPQLRNTGRAAVGGATLSLGTTSPFATVVASSAGAGAVNPFADGVASSALRLELLPGAPSGATVEYTLTLTYEGLDVEYPASFVIGEPSVVASFDFEAGAAGWNVGTPNNATTGNWVVGDPIGTAAQPEDDHSPAGTDCWFTGQGVVGGAVGANDVDGGSTALWSPSFDLSSAQSARLAFWLWYSNDAGGNANQDVFSVELSSDGGTSWTQALVVGPGGAQASGDWYEYELVLDAYVALTADVRARFIAADLGAGSIVEAALDDVVLEAFLDCPMPTSYCVSNGALMGASGSASVAQNDLVLEVTGASPNEFGLFYYGDQMASVPTGNGTRCVGGSLWRLPAAPSGPLGSQQLALDLTAPPAAGAQITAGSTWHFQFWYRTPSVGAGYDFSDGLRVTFCP